MHVAREYDYANQYQFPAQVSNVTTVEPLYNTTSFFPKYSYRTLNTAQYGMEYCGEFLVWFTSCNSVMLYLIYCGSTDHALREFQCSCIQSGPQSFFIKGADAFIAHKLCILMSIIISFETAIEDHLVSKRLFVLTWICYSNIGSTVVYFGWNVSLIYCRYHQHYCHYSLCVDSACTCFIDVFYEYVLYQKWPSIHVHL